MPPKGYKRPVPGPVTHCEECGLLLPAARLSMVAPQLVNVMMELGSETSHDLDAESPRARVDRMLSLRTQQVHVAKARVAAIVDSITLATCLGHEPRRAKPGRKPREESADPSTPPGVEITKKRRKLRAVQTGGGDG